MNGTGTVAGIFTAAESEAEVQRRDSVEAVAGSGLRGDRFFEGNGADLTLIEREAIEAIGRESDISLAPGAHRRNVETRDVALNHLVGRRFRVGDVVCRGDALCEPCSHLQGLTEKGIVSALLHRGGLEATILEDGTISEGDEITPLD